MTEREVHLIEEIAHLQFIWCPYCWSFSKFPVNKTMTMQHMLFQGSLISKRGFTIRALKHLWRPTFKLPMSPKTPLVDIRSITRRTWPCFFFSRWNTLLAILFGNIDTTSRTTSLPSINFSTTSFGFFWEVGLNKLWGIEHK